MNIFEQVKQVKEDPRYKDLTFEKKVKVNQYLADQVTRSADFYNFKADQQQELKRAILTTMPGISDKTYADPEVEDRAKKLLEQADSMRTGKADISFLDGIQEGSRDYLTGKVVNGIADLFIKGDYTESLYGDDIKDIEKYRDYVANVYRPEGAADYRAGKIIGNILGFGADAVGMSMLYGSVGAPGLIGKALGQKVLQESFTKAGAYIPKMLLQGAIETTGYIGETALADYITGKLDEPNEVTSFIQNIPSTAGKGLAYFAFGESLGLGLGAAFKNLKKVYSKKGFRPDSLMPKLNESLDAVTEAWRTTLKEGTISKDNLKALRSAGFDDEAISKLKRRATDANLVKDFKALEDDPDKLRQASLKILYGMETENVGGALKVTTFDNEPLKRFEILENDKELKDFLIKQNRKLLNRSWETSYKLAGDELGKLELKFEIGDGKIEPIKVKQVSKIFEVRDTVPTKTLENTAKKLLKSEDIKVVPVEGYFKSKFPAKTNTIFIPTKIENPDQAKKFAKQYFQQLEYLSDGKIKVDSRALSRFVGSSSYVKYNKTFLKEQLSVDQFKIDPEGTVSLKLDPEQDWLTFDTLEDAAAHVHASMYTPGEVGAILSRKKGYRLEVDPDSGKLTIDTGGEVITKESMTDLFKDPNLRPNLPYEKRPKFVWLNENILTEESLGEGSITELREKIKQFEKEKAQIINLYADDTGEVNVDNLSFKVKAVIHENGFERTFDTLDQAKRWLSRDHKVYENLREDLYEKGWKLSPASGGFKIQSAGKDPIFVKSLDEAREQVAKVDDIFNVPEFFNENEISQAETVVKNFSKYQDYLEKELTGLYKKQARYEKKGYADNRLIQLFNKWFVPVRERIASSGNKAALELFDEGHTANRLFTSKYAEAKLLMQGLFHGKGREFSLTELNNMGDILLKEVEPSEWFKVAEELKIDLKPEHIKTMQAVRDALDVLGEKFGIPAKDYIKNYFPRLRDMKQADFIQMISTPRSGIGDQWFKHLRTEDFVSTQFQNNIEQIMDLYLRVGYRELYLGNTVEKIANYTRAARAGKTDPIPNDILKLLEDTNEKIIGRVYSSDKARNIADRIEANRAHADKLLKKAQKTNMDQEVLASKLQAEMNRDYGIMVQDAVTSALMAFKMKMPLRNMSQVFTVLGSTTGYSPVLKAQKFIGDSPDEAVKFYRELYEKGIIKPREGKAFDLGQVHNAIKNLNHTGLNNFYNSDDYTRLVASKTASILFQENYPRLAKGEIDIETFMKNAKFNHLDEVDRIKATSLIQQGDIAGAETLLQRRLTDLTMFSYDQMSKPEGMNSMVGKLFGQYSTYPFSFAQFLRRGFKAEPVKFTARLLIGGSLIAKFYSDVLGMDYMLPDNPLQTVMFTGGPAMTTGLSAYTDGLRLIQDPSIGKVRGISKEIGRTFVPLYGVSSKVIEGMHHITEGDYHAGLINFMGAKVKEGSAIRNIIE